MLVVNKIILIFIKQHWICVENVFFIVCGIAIFGFVVTEAETEIIFG